MTFQVGNTFHTLSGWTALPASMTKRPPEPPGSTSINWKMTWTREEHSAMPIKISGHTHLSITDLAAATGLSTKTLRSYISKGILPEPEKLKHGLSEFSVFSAEYIKQAVQAVRDLPRSHRQSRG
jgi:predicted DNA-binding transcriptional regulator AlpA